MWLLLFKLLVLTECVVPFFATLAAAELRILPAVNPHVHDMTTGSSEPVTFSCDAPDLTSTEAGLKWFNNQDEEITSTAGSKYTSDFGRKLVLRIPNPTDDDAGTYTCRGLVNGVAEEGSISLELFRGINMTSPLTQYATQGSDAKIWCRLTKTNLEKDVSWYHTNWQLIRPDDKYRVGYEDGAGQEGDYLEIKDIQLDDGGKYICNIDLMSIGKSMANEIQVVVTGVPGKVRITVQDTRATKLELAITPPADDGGQPVIQYLLKYKKLNNGEEEKSRTIDRVAGEAMTKVELEGLDPHTQYSIKVYAINNVGSGAERQFLERTAD